jgi:cation diffusion facilitator family transporter
MSSDFKYVKNIIICVLVLNLVVALAKLGYGSLTGALSMVADGYHSLFDVLINAAELMGCYIASRPADKSHPYGHKKYETLTSIIVAILLLVVGIEIFKGATGRLFENTTSEITTISFLIMFVTITMNYLVTKYEYKRGQELKSQILIADSKHMKVDVYVSFSVIVSLIAMKLGYYIIDPIVSIIIAFVIAYDGYRLIKEGAKSFFDMCMIDEQDLCDIAVSVGGVESCHKIRSRGTLGDIKVDLHVRVPAETNIVDAHRITHEVKDALKAKYEDISDVVIHVEPSDQERK